MTPQTRRPPGRRVPFPRRGRIPSAHSFRRANARRIGPLPLPPQAAGGGLCRVPPPPAFPAGQDSQERSGCPPVRRRGTLISQGSLPTGPGVTTVLQGQAAFARTPKGEFQRGTASPFSFQGGCRGKYRVPAANQRGVEANCPEGARSPSGELRREKGEQRGGRNGAKGGFKRYEAYDGAISPGNFLGARQGLSF